MNINLTAIHADGGLENDTWELEYGLTIEQFFRMAFSGCKRERYMMLVNDYPVDWDYLLLPGDRVYVRPFRLPPPTN